MNAKFSFSTNPSILDTRIHLIKTSVKRTLLGRSKRQEKNTCPFQIRAGINVKFLIRAGLYILKSLWSRVKTFLILWDSARLKILDFRLRGNDAKGGFKTFYETIKINKAIGIRGIILSSAILLGFVDSAKMVGK
jgi:hypothetical protein